MGQALVLGQTIGSPILRDPMDPHLDGDGHGDSLTVEQQTWGVQDWWHDQCGDA